MIDFCCTIWQFIAFGFSCLSGGISLGITIGKNSRQKKIDELTEEIIKMTEGSDNE